MGANAKQHFSDEQWSDYVRNLMPASTVVEVQRHLDSGCMECRAAERFWSAFYEVGPRAFALEPPAEAIRAVEAAFASRKAGAFRHKTAIPAQIIFDNLLQPAAVGVRGGKQAPRRIMSRAGRWVIDLQLEQPSGNKLIITGQVVNRWRSSQGAQALAVSLMRERAVLSTTSTNQFGEFQISGESGSDLHLYIDTPGRRAVEVPLPSDG